MNKSRVFKYMHRGPQVMCRFLEVLCIPDRPETHYRRVFWGESQPENHRAVRQIRPQQPSPAKLLWPPLCSAR